jgi:glycolate oxidase FAD binding subunit
VTGRVLDGALKGAASTLLRLEGFGPSVEYRLSTLTGLLAAQGRIEVLDEAQSRQVWREIRDCVPYADGTDRPVWRISMAPSQGWKMVAELRLHAGADVFYDWQGGLIWARMESEPDAEGLRALIAHFGGGHATLVRASGPVRAASQVFQPQAGALGALARRLKDQFDPKGILNPGRMG